ncbi:MAG: hypothetical protein ACPGO3_02560 [Magnetospiraceae bacterium]
MVFPRQGFALLLIMVLGGCLPEFTHPIAVPDATTPDPRLISAWQGHDDDEIVYMHLVNREDGGLDALMIQYGEDQGEPSAGWDQMIAYTAHLGTHDYLSVRDPDESEVYLLVRYVIDGDSLTLWLADEDGFEAAIRDGKIAGTLPKKEFASAKITASTAELAAFLSAADPATLFDPKEPVTLTRLEKPGK